jgi:tRNA (guanine37-N1)-methyltransferase
MKIDIATLFPEMCEAVLSASIVGRARKAGFIEISCTNIRDFSDNKHKRVDDTSFGGGVGLIMQAQPVFACVESLRTENSRVIYLSPQGKTLTQDLVKQLAREEHLIFLCGHYEGVDQRALDALNAEEVSVGDYVLTGGELPALIITDAVARLIPGVLPDEQAYINDSHYDGLLEHPLYTKPAVWRGMAVPEVLLSGNHAAIDAWRKAESLRVTREKRPDMQDNEGNT